VLTRSAARRAGVVLPVTAVLALLVALAARAATQRSGPDAGPGASPPPATPAPRGGAPQPAGQPAGWTLIFRDEFEAAGVDPAHWSDESSAEADGGHGNPGNDQLEWNQAANCSVSGGELVLTARREEFTSPSGTRYGWTSCLLSTGASVAFRYGYIEERAILPHPAGFWPAFWTWQAPGLDRHIETDAYELHTTRPRELLLTQHSGEGGGCRWRPRFDPSAGWHTYGVAIEPGGTTWYVDGARICGTGATSTGTTSIILNLAVDGRDPPAAATATAAARVDYVRAWRR
jgi:beta-glucanase (GH16 family)